MITDLVFPDHESDGVDLSTDGGAARVVSLDAYEVDTIWR